MIIAMVVVVPPVAEASHARFFHHKWEPTGNTNEIQFTLTDSWRRNSYSCVAPSTSDPTQLASVACSGSDGYAGVGDLIQESTGGTNFYFGDGGYIGGPNGGALVYYVTSIDPALNTLTGVAVDPRSFPTIDTTISHTYSSAGTYTSYIESCCRLGSYDGHMNNGDGYYRAEAVVNVGTGNRPPVSSLLPIVNCLPDAVCSISIPVSDPDGDAVNFRLSTSAEAAGSYGSFTQPTGATVSSTGVYTWDTTGIPLSTYGGATLYSTQVMIEDLDSAGVVKSKVALDFFIQITSDTSSGGTTTPTATTPAFSGATPCGQTLTLAPGATHTFSVEATDADSGDVVTLNTNGVPFGATMSPGLPTSGNPVQSQFSWTPGGTQEGTYGVSYSATDSTGRQSLCSVTLVVAQATGATFSSLLHVNTTTALDGATFGTVSGATALWDQGIDVAEPPAPPTYPFVRAYFGYGTTTTEQLDESYYAPSTGATWPLVVESAHFADADGDFRADAYNVDLTWSPSSFGSISSTYVVHLVDGSTVVDMTTQSSYSYVVPAGAPGGELSRGMEIRLALRAPDLDITDILAPSIVVDGKSATFEVNISNVGTLASSAANLTLTVGGVKVAEVSFGGLAVGALTTVPITWSPVQGRGDVVLEFTAVDVLPSEASSTLVNNVETLTQFVTQYKVSLTAVGITQPLEVAPGDFQPALYGEVFPKAHVNYTYELRNEGNADDGFAFAASVPDPSSWSAEPNLTSFLLQPGETVLVNLTVKPLVDFDFDVTASSMAAIVAASAGDSSARAVGFSNTSLVPTYKLQLKAGWNQISFPVVPRYDASGSNAADVLAEISSLQKWNGTGYEAATEILPGEGYWAFVPTDRVVNVTGDRVGYLGPLSLGTGWRMVGAPAAATGVATASGDYEPTLWHWNVTATPLTYSMVHAGTHGFDVVRGEGYWFFVRSGTVSYSAS